MSHAVPRCGFGCRDLTELLAKILTERGYSLFITAEREFACVVNQKLCDIVIPSRSPAEVPAVRRLRSFEMATSTNCYLPGGHNSDCHITQIMFLTFNVSANERGDLGCFVPVRLETHARHRDVLW